MQKYRNGRVLGGEGFIDRIIRKFGGDDVSSARGKIVVRASRAPIEEMAKQIERQIVAVMPERKEHKGTSMYLLRRLGYGLEEIGTPNVKA